MNFQLNHINLTVPDVQASQEFFVKYLDFTCAEVKGDNKLAVLVGKSGFTLVLMSESFNRHGNHAYPDSFHIGFLVDSTDEVNQLYASLQRDGHAVDSPPASMRGVFGFYFTAPGNVLTEVSCALT
jgi:catechol 2,3-dioxygenase-like lactoylglutathione lyase family enzyme